MINSPLTSTEVASHPSEATDKSAQPRPLEAGYQGQPGSFGGRAALRCGRPVAFSTFEKLLRALIDGQIDVAVLPAVNRVAGPIVEPLDALAKVLKTTESRLEVTDEIIVPVRLVLAAPAGTPLAAVREVYSQPPALRQCGNLLARLDAVPIETHDTAFAAVRVAELGGARAAVCSEEAALAAHLVILEEDVSDLKPNATRFWRIERSGGERFGHADVSDAPETIERSVAAPVAPRFRILSYEGARVAATLAEAGAELLAIPGLPDAAVRGFAVVKEDELARTASRLQSVTGDKISWLSPPPEFVRPPRMKELPMATEVRESSVVTIGPFSVGGGKRAVIAGPCAVESPEQVERLARAVARAGATALRGGVFKPRTSPYAFQGHGLEALAWLKAAGDAVGLPIITEVMAPAQVEPIARVADILQIGARNCQNYDLLNEAGASGRPVFLKRGFGTTVEEWLSSAEYLLNAGCKDVMLCERGIRTFEKSTRGTLDLGGLLAARSLTHLPLLADPSHAAGRRDLVSGLARAAWGAGVDGLMIEVHDAPESALSDGPQALLPEDLERLLDELGLLPGTTGSVERIRSAIDVVDAEIGKLASRRLELCRRVAVVKKSTGRPLRDEAREASVRTHFAEALGPDATNAARLADALIALGLEAEGWKAEGDNAR
ncbi:MAG: 3-deoxy-7-phosphoheptulonate synthase [Thermoanaerobaculia bacterium]